MAMPKGKLGPNYGRIWRHCDGCGKKDEMRPPGHGITGGLCNRCANEKRSRISELNNLMRKSAQEVCLAFARGITSTDKSFTPIYREWVKHYEEWRSLRGEEPRTYGEAQPAQGGANG